MRHHLNGFIESMRAKCYSPDTLVGRRKSISYFLTYAEEKGVKKIGAVTREMVLSYMLHLRTEKRLKNGSIQTHFSDLKNFFLHLERNGELTRNPCDGVTRPKDEDRLPAAVLTPSEVEKILATPSATHPVGIRDRAVLELLYSTGLRRAELTALMVADLDLKGGFVRVTKGKGGRGRLVPLGERACAAIARYLPIRHQWARRSQALSDALWVSPQTPFHHIGKVGIYCIVKRNAKRAGLNRHAGPHLWRHTFATHLLRNGAHLFAVQKLLGHQSIKNTEIYTRVSVGDVQQTQCRCHPRSRRKA